MSLPKLRDVPGFVEEFARAVEAEDRVRATPYSGAFEDICGFQVMPLTLYHLNLLEGFGSPFVSGGQQASKSDFQIFFWIVSPGFKLGDWWGRFRVARKIPRVPYSDLAQGIEIYISDTFQDAPGGADSRKRPLASMAAYWIHRLASAYHWTEESILHLPLKKLFQYRNLIESDRLAECGKSAGSCSSNVTRAVIHKYQMIRKGMNGDV